MSIPISLVVANVIHMLLIVLSVGLCYMALGICFDTDAHTVRRQPVEH